jgi:glycosyltransferase 2 family protein
VAVGLTWLSIWKTDWTSIGAALGGAAWPWVLAACLLVVLDRMLNATRWLALLAPVSRKPPAATIIRIFFVSTFVGTFLPSTVGSDAVRAWSVTQDGVSSPEAIASVVLDRLLGVTSIVLSAGVGLLLLPRVLAGGRLLRAFAGLAAVCGLALAVIFSTRVDDVLRRHLGSWPERVRRPLGRLLDALQAYRSERRLLAGVLLASLGVQALRILLAWMLGQSLALGLPLSTYVALVPVMVLVMLLPVTINGLGTGQLAFVWGFRQVGVSVPAAFALSVLFAGLGIIGNLPGGLLYAFAPAKRARTGSLPSS